MMETKSELCSYLRFGTFPQQEIKAKKTLKRPMKTKSRKIAKKPKLVQENEDEIQGVNIY